MDTRKGLFNVNSLKMGNKISLKINEKKIFWLGFYNENKGILLKFEKFKL